MLVTLAYLFLPVKGRQAGCLNPEYDGLTPFVNKKNDKSF